ncbi:hypothetical protein PP707_02335 [Acetobacter pasteurianus]|nr:hypothetical protein [Acetobacter pasteurianus]
MEKKLKKLKKKKKKKKFRVDRSGIEMKGLEGEKVGNVLVWVVEKFKILAS